MTTSYQQHLQQKRCAKVKTAIKMAADWWHTEYRYQRQAEFALWEVGYRNGIAIVLDLPDPTIITVVRVSCFLSKKRSFPATSFKLNSLRAFYKKCSSMGWKILKGSDTLILLCNLDERRKMTHSLTEGVF